MSGPYWDVRTCSWQGEVEVVPLLLAPPPVAAAVFDTVPTQVPPVETEQVLPARAPA